MKITIFLVKYLFKTTDVATNIFLFFVPKKLRKYINNWKPIHLCQWFIKNGLDVPQYFVGSTANETLRPTGSGDQCGIASESGCSSCPDHYTCVDEATYDTGSYVSETNNAGVDLYAIANHSIGSGTINSVTVYAVGKWSGSYDGLLKLAIKTHSSSYYSANWKTLTTSWVEYSEQWTNNPNTGVAWTWDEIDAMQAGIQLYGDTSSTAYCTQVYVVVNYNATSAPTVTTQAVTSIAQTTATGNGNITATGGEDASSWGVCWNTSGTPTTSDSIASGSGTGGTGAFTASMTGLTAGQHYYVRAYATNSVGTSYGSVVEFNTVFDKVLTDIVKISSFVPKKTGRTILSQIGIYPTIINKSIKTFVENVIINPILATTGTFYKTITEVVKITGSLVNKVILVLSEIIKSSDIIQKGLSAVRTLTEIIVISSSATYRGARTLLEHIVVNPLYGAFLSASRLFTETIQAIGSITRLTGKAFLEIVKAIDIVVDFTKVLINTFSEIIKITEIAISNVLGAVRVFLETIKIVPAFSAIGVFYETLTEQIKLVLTFDLVRLKTFTEVVKIIGSTYSQIAKTFTEVVKVVVSISSDIAKLLVERVIVIYSFIKNANFFKVLSDVIKVAENLGQKIGKTFSDVIVVVPTFDKALTKLFSEILKVVDVSTSFLTKVFSEVIKVVVSIGSSLIKVFSEVIKVVLTFSPFAIGKALLENITIGRNKIKLVLNGTEVGLWEKIARITGSWSPIARIKGAWTKIARNDN